MSQTPGGPSVSRTDAERNPPDPVDFDDLLNPPREDKRTRIVAFLPNWAKNELLAMISEYVGTVMFLIFAFGGTNVANVPAQSSGSTSITSAGSNPALLLYISLCFGFSLTVNAWIFYRISGGLFNPAVSFALALIGSITWLRAVLLTLCQILGGITAAAIVSALCPGTLNVSVGLAGGTSTAQGLFLEMFLTAELVFTIIMLAAEKHKATFLAPVGIGLSLFIAELWGVYYTGGALNPARAFGPSVVVLSFPHYHWIYWLGPYLGAALAAGFYLLNKMLKFEHVNPGQDGDGDNLGNELEAILSRRNLGTSSQDGETDSMRRRRHPQGTGQELFEKDESRRAQHLGGHSVGGDRRHVHAPIDGTSQPQRPDQMV